MALTNAERQKRHYERQKAKAKAPGDASTSFLARPFFRHYQEDSNTDAFEIPLHLAGVSVPVFEDDQPATFPADVKGLELPDADNSVQRAELIIASLIDAAAGLAGVVNTYKRKEIAQRIQEVEADDVPVPEKRKQALADIVRLKKMLDQLDRQVRWTFPQWKVTDV